MKTTPTEQRIAIAKLCGCNMPPQPDWTLNLWPDYLNDLNAMHEAERLLECDAAKRIYLNELRKVCGDDLGAPAWKCVNATAAQRAEALLITLDPFGTLQRR